MVGITKAKLPRNLLSGFTPAASNFDTAPDNLANVTDNDPTTSTGTGSTVKGGAGVYGTLIFDTGSINRILITGEFKLWSSTGGTRIYMKVSNDGVNYRDAYNGNYIANFANNSGEPTYVQEITGRPLNTRYIQFTFYVDAAATAYLKVYDVAAHKLP